jgi:hypothetical protein
LEGPDHQGEDTERLHARGPGICGCQSGGDTSMSASWPSVYALHGIGRTRGLVQERGRWTAGPRVAPVLDRQVAANDLLERQRPERLALLTDLVGNRIRDEVLLRVEVGVEGPVGQTRVNHERRHAGAIDAVALD